VLGVFVAGLFPGLVYYLTFWYRSDERSVRVAFILASATLAGAFGGAIAYGVGRGMNGVGGLSAWRWLFVVEGAPSCLSAGLVWWLLPDYPEEVLEGREREVAVARLRVEGSKRADRSMTWEDARGTLVDWRLYGHYLIYFCLAVPFSSLSFFSPSIVAGLQYVDLQAQLMTVPPYAVAYGKLPGPQSVLGSVANFPLVMQIAVSYSADRFNARGLHAAALAVIGAIGFMASALLPPDADHGRYGCLIVAATGSFSCIAPLLGWLTCNVHSTASVGLAIAINVSVGAGIGQIPGVWTYKDEERDRGFPTGHWVNAAMLFVVAVGSVGLRLLYGYRNRKLFKESNGQEVRLYKL
jgi:hypothetical protein